MSDHTPEPWQAYEGNGGWCIEAGSKLVYIARVFAGINSSRFNDEEKANARRVVACVDACAGYDTVALEAAGLGYFHKAVTEMVAAIKLKDEALEQLTPLVHACKDITDPETTVPALITALSDAQQALVRALHVLNDDPAFVTSIEIKGAEEKASLCLAKAKGETT